MQTADAFTGAKIALFFGENILVYLRDDKSSIPFPGMWDLPGGGREAGETPMECMLREVEEEFGLRLNERCVHWTRIYPFLNHKDMYSYFMVGTLTAEEVAAIQFGDEGQRWEMMEIDTFLHHPNAVPHFQDRLKDYLRERGESPGGKSATL